MKPLVKEIARRYLTLRAFLRDQVWFPKNTTKGYIFRGGTSLLFSMLMTTVFFLFPQKEVKTLVMVGYLGIIALSTLFSNAPFGFLQTGLGIAFLLALYYPLSRQFTELQAIEIITFIISGVCITVIIHISKRVELIKRFNHEEEQYQEIITRLRKDLEYAKKEIRVRDEFISIASHELKTPLTTTLLKLQIALHNIRNVSLAKFSVQNLLGMLESAEQQTKRLGKIINDLLNVSIIQTGKLELEIEECDLAAVASDVVERFTEKAEKDGITITYEASEPIILHCDRVRLEQVITNLISNSLKYGNGKPVKIYVKKQGSQARISIKDNGIGIPKDKRDRIFNLFERGVTTTEYKGLGIGLYISNQIVKAHEGRIVVNSKLHRGSEFIVEIPIK